MSELIVIFKKQSEITGAFCQGCVTCWKQPSVPGCTVLIIWSYSRQQCLGRLWCLNGACLGLRRPKCAEKMYPMPLHRQQPEPLIQNMRDPCFHIVKAQILTAIHMEIRNPDLNYSLSFLFLANRSVTCVICCCCSPSALRFAILCVQGCSSAYLGCNECLLGSCCLQHSPLAFGSVHHRRS